MYGRGAYDMKSGLAAAMLAVKAAQGMSLAGDVMLSAVVDEEYGSIGTEALLAEWERWPADAVLIAEPTELAISIAHRGFVWVDIDTFGVRRMVHGRTSASTRSQDGQGPCLPGCIRPKNALPTYARSFGQWLAARVHHQRR